MAFWSLDYSLKLGLERMSNFKMSSSLGKLAKDKAETLVSWLCALARHWWWGSLSHRLRHVLRIRNWQTVCLNFALSLPWGILLHSRHHSTRTECEHSQHYTDTLLIWKTTVKSTSLRTDPCFGGRKSHCVDARGSSGQIRGLRLGRSLHL